MTNTFTRLAQLLRGNKLDILATGKKPLPILAWQGRDKSISPAHAYGRCHGRATFCALTHLGQGRPGIHAAIASAGVTGNSRLNSFRSTS